MKNMPASVRARLLNLARKQGIPFQRLLTLYNQEGLLHRIVSTEYENSIVLKGGLLFYQLQGMVARPTKDIDLLGEDESGSEATLRAILAAASSVDIDDGLEFDHDSIDVAPIAGQTEHGGVRATIVGYLGTARTRLQIDMGFGDVMTGGPVRRSYRTIFGDRSFSIRTYSDETVAAEKIEAVVSLGVINSRYKDIFDLFELLVVAELSEDKVVNAAANTFRNRQTSLPEHPESLSDVHWTAASFVTEWNRFLRRIEAISPGLDVINRELLPRLRRIYDRVRARIAGYSDE
jgi:predicted nucleotidyltransferase component of viral defense system